MTLLQPSRFHQSQLFKPSTLLILLSLGTPFTTPCSGTDRVAPPLSAGSSTKVSLSSSPVPSPSVSPSTLSPSSPSPLAPAEHSTSKPKAQISLIPWFNHFSLRAYGILQPSAGSLFTGGATWQPVLPLRGRWTISPQITVEVLRSEKIFLMGNLVSRLDFNLNPRLKIGLGPGIQVWTEATKARLVGEVGGSYRLDKRTFRGVDRILAGYGLLFKAQDLTHPVHNGLGFRF